MTSRDPSYIPEADGEDELCDNLLWCVEDIVDGESVISQLPHRSADNLILSLAR